MNSFLEKTIFILLAMTACLTVLVATAGRSYAQPVKVEISGEKGNYQLLRNGLPYRVKGGGLDDSEMQSLADHGGNSIRTWATDTAGDKTLQLLDHAQELGITVSLCLYTAPERSGFNYDDSDEVARQLESHRKEVLRYKNHPALLAWIIGNELNHDYSNPAVYDAVNEISKMIHKLDPNHPTTTTLAGFDAEILEVIEQRAADLDFISFQLYGQLYNLQEFISKMEFSQPYFITEWGAIGHWEVPKTEWGAPLEQHSSEKADTYLRGYQEVIEPFGKQVLGNHVFLWGQKQEKTPTWYGLFTETGEETEVMDVMHYIWNGAWPENRTPRIESVRLNDKTAADSVRLEAGQSYTAKLKIADEDGDPLSYLWQVKKESGATTVGGDFEKEIANLKGLISDEKASSTVLLAPQNPGAYRLFVYAYDGHGHAAHANIPFYVELKTRTDQK
jgi:hypothetical protein